MKTRMWLGEADHYGMTDRKFYVDDPDHIPRVGEFVDGDGACGWVSQVKWNMSKAHPAIKDSCKISTVYVYLKDKKNE